MTATPGYRALTGTLASFDDDRVLFEIEGDRALEVVNGLLTNTLEGLEDGVARYAFALTAKGRPVAEMRVLPPPGFEEARSAADEGPVTLWIDVPAAAAPPFREHLGRFVPPIFATHRTIDIARLSLAGPHAPDASGEIPAALGATAARGAEALAEDLRCVSLGDGTEWEGLLVRREAVEGPGFDVYVPAGRGSAAGEALAGLAAAGGGARATGADREIVRIERGIPVFGREITGDVLPQETGQEERAISFSKGCYTGQEVVARIHYRGHVNRHLRGLKLPAAGRLAPGDELSFDGKTVATTTSVTDSPRFGPIALAYVRREIEPGTRLVGPADLEATMCLLPFT